jgi:hypothetical protein
MDMKGREAKRVVIVISWLLRVGVERGHFARGPARYRREEMGGKNIVERG